MGGAHAPRRPGPLAHRGGRRARDRAAALEADVYFARPYHSWERGLNEHTNGLVRQYFGKSESLREVDPAKVRRVTDLLNGRPRKVLGYRTPSRGLRRGRPRGRLTATTHSALLRLAAPLVLPRPRHQRRDSAGTLRGKLVPIRKRPRSSLPGPHRSSCNRRCKCLHYWQFLPLARNYLALHFRVEWARRTIVVERKYQVFVSSTYDDLQVERQEVMQVLLELDCIPSGMELFPAADEDQWSLIKGVIDDCDYYIVIIAGRYGSIGHGGISYTEMEYRYAVDKGKPVAAFLHGNPGSIPQRLLEETEEGKAKLKAFCDLAKRKMCKDWTTPHELGSVVARSLIRLKKTSLGIGWVRGDQVPDREDAKEILRLHKQIEDLEATISEARTTAPYGTEDLAQGNDTFEVDLRATVMARKTFNRSVVKHKELVTWNKLFRTISPLMIHESDEQSIIDFLETLFYRLTQSALKRSANYKHHRLLKCHITLDCFQTIIVQIRALGLIAKSTRNRSVKDTSAYWTLTPYGDNIMNRLRAIKRTSSKDSARDQ